MHGAEPSAEGLANALGGKRAGRAWKARCPVHDDAVASLAIGTKGGRTVFRCHAGCDQEAVLAALRQAGHWPAINGASAPKPIIAATYDYRDEHGELLFQSVRYVPKDFRQRRPDGGGGWIWKMDGVRVIPYRLPEILEAIASGHPVFVVEGEKDADSLARLGIAATTNVSGAGKWRTEHAAFLKGADVIIIPDNDEPGREHAEMVAKSLAGIATRTRLLRLPNLPEKGDASDWLAAGGTADALWRLADAAPDWSEGGAQMALQPVPWVDLMRMQFRDRQMILRPVIPEKGLAMIYATRGVGKTHVALGISVAVATGGRFLRWQAPEPRKVLHIDGEMPGATLQERLRWTMNGTLAPTDMLSFLVGDLTELGVGNIAQPEVQQAIERHLDGVSLLTLDNLSCLSSISENDAEGWAPIQEWLLRLRRRGIAVLIVHHAGKGGEQRGTSRREDVLDTSISFTRPSDYKPAEGARFEVHYKKARGIIGAEVEPFEAWLKVDGLNATWEMRDVEQVNENRVVKLLADDMSIRDISEATGIPKSTVHDIKRKIEARKVSEANQRFGHYDS